MSGSPSLSRSVPYPETLGWGDGQGVPLAASRPVPRPTGTSAVRHRWSSGSGSPPSSLCRYQVQRVGLGVGGRGTRGSIHYGKWDVCFFTIQATNCSRKFRVVFNSFCLFLYSLNPSQCLLWSVLEPGMLETKGADPCPWVGVWGRQQGEGVTGAESLWMREHSSKGRGLGVASRQRE